MIGFALSEGLVDFAKHYGDSSAFATELDKIKGDSINGRFYVVENLEAH